jgi:hypothetical protein
MSDVDSSPISTENFVIAKRETNAARGEFVPLSSLNPDSKSETAIQVPVKGVQHSFKRIIFTL